MPRFRMRVVCLSLVLTSMLVAALPGRAVAQQDETDPNAPLVIFNVASVERLLNHAIVAFDTAGRPELTETLGGALERVNDLKGLNRNMSMGVMVFVDNLSPTSVAYVPVKNLDELLKTLEIGPATTRKVEDNRFEILIGPQTLHAKVRGDYAYISNEAAAIDREFNDPEKYVRKLSSVYDLSATINLKNISPVARDVFINVMRSSNEIGLQRRDDEPETAYRLRKAAAMRNFEVIEQLITQGQELTIGWTVSGTDKTAGLEVVVVASPGSELASYFNELKNARSHFANLLSTSRPLTGSISWKLDKSAKKFMHEIIAATEKQLGLATKPAEGDETAESNPVAQLVKVLNATVDAGQFDLAAQFVGQPPGPFVLVGGVKVSDSTMLDEALTAILGRLNSNRAFAEVRTNAFSYQGVNVHRLDFARVDEGGRRLFGDKISLYLGVGNGAAWFAVGGDDAPTELKRAIDKVAEPIPATVSNSPFQLVMNFSSWMDIFAPDGDDNGFAGVARRAFAKGGDALRMDVRPIEDGVQFRLQFDEAFIRLVGTAIARGMDRRQQ